MMRRLRSMFERSKPESQKHEPSHPDEHHSAPSATAPSSLPPDEHHSNSIVTPSKLQRPPQTSSFLTKLSPEVRFLIYDQLWLTAYGSLRQHIVYHGPDPGSRHFCHWTCCLPGWEVTDGLQSEIQHLRQEGLEVWKEYTRRLQSAWLNHWMCGEHIRQTTGKADVVNGRVTTAFGSCWANPSSTKEGLGAFMSMLMVCKEISAECLDSIYRSTTFIFTDAMSYQVLVGLCQLPPGWENNPAATIPAFTELARKIELCLPANFTDNVPCSDLRVPNRPRHDGLDFHWLHLDRFSHLTSLSIWIASRDAPFVSDPSRPPPERLPVIVDLDTDALGAALRGLNRVEEVQISAALHESVTTSHGEEDGYVAGEFVGENVRLWKRGTGDLHHPWPGTVNEGGIGDGMLLSTSTRTVKRYTQARSSEHPNVRPFI